jgi:hypothetical protein
VLAQAGTRDLVVARWRKSTPSPLPRHPRPQASHADGARRQPLGLPGFPDVDAPGSPRGPPPRARCDQRAVVRAAARSGVAVPVNTMLLALLERWIGGPARLVASVSRGGGWAPRRPGSPRGWTAIVSTATVSSRRRMAREGPTQPTRDARIHDRASDPARSPLVALAPEPSQPREEARHANGTTAALSAMTRMLRSRRVAGRPARSRRAARGPSS